MSGQRQFSWRGFRRCTVTCFVAVASVIFVIDNTIGGSHSVSETAAWIINEAGLLGEVGSILMAGGAALAGACLIAAHRHLGHRFKRLSDSGWALGTGILLFVAAVVLGYAGSTTNSATPHTPGPRASVLNSPPNEPVTPSETPSKPRKPKVSPSSPQTPAKPRTLLASTEPTVVSGPTRHVHSSPRAIASAVPAAFKSRISSPNVNAERAQASEPASESPVGTPAPIESAPAAQTTASASSATSASVFNTSLATLAIGGFVVGSGSASGGGIVVGSGSASGGGTVLTPGSTSEPGNSLEAPSQEAPSQEATPPVIESLETPEAAAPEESEGSAEGNDESSREPFSTEPEGG